MPDPIPTERRGRGALILLVLLAVGFAAVLLWMLNLRLSHGDSYPPYSSLRADPVGTRALYEAIGRIDRLSAERNLRRIQFLEGSDRCALLFLGLHPNDLTLDTEGEELEVIDRLLEDGCRLIIALRPDFDRRDPEAWKRPFARDEDKAKDDKEDEKGPDEKKPDEKPDQPEKKNTPSDEPAEDVADGGFFGLKAVSKSGKPEALAQAGRDLLDGIALPEWHGSHFLTLDDDAEWSVLADVDNQVTTAILYRGHGSIVVTTDSFPFSNEALVSARHSEFIIALFGDAKRIVFDETHLGVVQEPGLMNLMRSYSLHGIVAGGILLFVLLLWQGAGSLLPVDPARDLGDGGKGHVEGRDSADGLVALLEVGLTPRALLEECLQRHTKSPSVRPTPPAVLEQARAIAAQTRAGQLAADHAHLVKLLTQRSNPNPDPQHGQH